MVQFSILENEQLSRIAHTVQPLLRLFTLALLMPIMAVTDFLGIIMPLCDTVKPIVFALESTSQISLA